MSLFKKKNGKANFLGKVAGGISTYSQTGAKIVAPFFGVDGDKASDVVAGFHKTLGVPVGRQLELPAHLQEAIEKSMPQTGGVPGKFKNFMDKIPAEAKDVIYNSIRDKNESADEYKDRLKAGLSGAVAGYNTAVSGVKIPGLSSTESGYVWAKYKSLIVGAVVLVVGYFLAKKLRFIK